jgi:hypothetical protein
MTKVARTAEVSPASGWIIPYAFATLIERSSITGNGISTPNFSLMLRVHARCE